MQYKLREDNAADIQRFVLLPYLEKLKIYIISTPNLWETVHLDELELHRRLNVVSGGYGGPGARRTRLDWKRRE